MVQSSNGSILGSIPPPRPPPADLGGEHWHGDKRSNENPRIYLELSVKSVGLLWEASEMAM